MDANFLPGSAARRPGRPEILVLAPHLLHRNALSLIAGLASAEGSGVLPIRREGPEADLGQYDRLRALALLDGEERLAEILEEGGPPPPPRDGA